jgi:hypothetical protein
LSAQQIDSLLLKEIKNNIFQQRQDIDALLKKTSSLQVTIGQQKASIVDLVTKTKSQEQTIDSLNIFISTNNQNIKTNSKVLETKIKETEKNAEAKISALDTTVGKNRSFWLYGTIGTLLLGGLMYWFLGKNIKASKSDVETQIKNTKKSLEEESVKLDNKLIELLETQFKVKQEETKANSSTNNGTVDHSLALKVADEIVRINKNLSRMESGTKGLKQLSSSVKRIQDNFASNGYEVVEMLGKDYSDGMKATANFVQDEDFTEGKRVITKIIKPQVNYKGSMIQTAQIEVTEA